jgi:hypothetical protein
VKYDPRMAMLNFLGTPFPIQFDAGKPRSDMGDGRIIINRESYRPETDEERIVLNVVRAGVDKYEDIVDLLTTQGDMEEDEILGTLKELKFRKRKRAVDFPCFFGLYNSKSAIAIKSSLRVSEE